MSETWLSSLDSDGDITLPGFQEPFRKDRNTKGGGVLYLFVESTLWKTKIWFGGSWSRIIVGGNETFRPPPKFICWLLLSPPSVWEAFFWETWGQISTRWLTMIFFFLATLTLKTLSGLMEIARIPMVLLWRTWRIILILHSSADKQRTLIMMENLRVY